MILERSLIALACLLPTAQAAADSLPGATLAREIETRLLAARDERRGTYAVRTEQVDTDGKPRYLNRLILEDSPYLLQHAHNPVNWYPWSEAAFATANRKDKPVFLSIGYSTCHWCHVMERESFDDPAVARLLNEHFIAIKVDRERRPDVDTTYMTAVVLFTGQGGWPMSSFLTPAGKTFWGGTYFPRDTFLQLLQEVHESWEKNRDDIVRQADEIALVVQRALRSERGSAAIDDAVIERAISTLDQMRDRVYGGMGDAPKFPQESNHLLLLDRVLNSGEADLIAWIQFDLDAMAAGGIHDHVGGGFHRYATDANWRIPHFEKMLYNQAQLLRVYLRAYTLTGEARYARVATGIIDFVERDLAAPDGGFYSALDADSEEGEGYYYSWTPAEVRAVLPPPLAGRGIAHFNISERGNFDGRNVLYTTGGRTEPPNDLETIRAGLLAARNRRVAPLRDEKIVTAWNALMVTALAEAAHALDDAASSARAARLAEGSINFLWRRHHHGDGQLWRTSLYGKPSVDGALDDYAALAEACIAMHDLTGVETWLTRARMLVAALDVRFLDSEAGGYFMHKPDPLQMARPKSASDGAVPSGNALTLTAQAKLVRRVADPAYRQNALELITAFAARIEREPSHYTGMLRAVMTMRRGAPGPSQFAAFGAAHVQSAIRDGRLRVTIALSEGFHLNARRPLQKDLIGTELAQAEPSNAYVLDDIRYPQSQLKQLGFRDERLALYEGEFEISARVKTRGGIRSRSPIRTRLTLQACNDRHCLPPETFTLVTPASVAPSD
ncbi:MAG: thioredoxin domain-containing protein [Pseudomonadota bacterium]|nr:thioredoxin domain-containing protein [Pseudomonadota bacterium]